ncbi:ATP-binding protein [Anoxynatronum sibiricum]|uniref:ATP-binding protein n=1 Tax=Anoxynatronum sibiricum TaxID=210623 RepID=A0ABU9VSD2_9CLOT
MKVASAWNTWMETFEDALLTGETVSVEKTLGDMPVNEISPEPAKLFRGLQEQPRSRERWRAVRNWYERQSGNRKIHCACACQFFICRLSNEQKDWREMQHFCVEQNIWVEAHYAALQPMKMKHEQGQEAGYWTFFCNNANKLESSQPIITLLDKHALVEEVRALAKKAASWQKEMQRYWIEGIFHEFDGNLEEAFQAHVAGYRFHGDLTKLLKWANTFDRLEWWRHFWLTEEKNISGSDRKNFRCIYQVLELASLQDQELGYKMVETVVKYPISPSWSSLKDMAAELEGKKLDQEALSLMEKLYRLFPRDQAAGDVYADTLLRMGRAKEAFHVREKVLQYAVPAPLRRAMEYLRMLATAMATGDISLCARLREYLQEEGRINRHMEDKGDHLTAYLLKLVNLWEKVDKEESEEKKAMMKTLAMLARAPEDPQDSKRVENPDRRIVDILSEEAHQPLLIFPETLQLMCSNSFEKHKHLLEQYVCRSEAPGSIMRYFFVLAQKISPKMAESLKELEANDGAFIATEIWDRVKEGTISKTRSVCLQWVQKINTSDRKRGISLLIALYGPTSLREGIASSPGLSTDEKDALGLAMEQLNREKAEKDSADEYKSSFRQGLIYIRMGRWKEAREAFHFLVEAPEKVDDQNKSTILVQLCEAYMMAEKGKPFLLKTGELLGYQAAAVRWMVMGNYPEKLTDRVHQLLQEHDPEAAVFMDAMKAVRDQRGTEATQMMESIRSRQELYLKGCTELHTAMKDSSNRNNGIPVKKQENRLVKSDDIPLKTTEVPTYDLNLMMTYPDEMDLNLSLEEILATLPFIKQTLESQGNKETPFTEREWESRQERVKMERNPMNPAGDQQKARFFLAAAARVQEEGLEDELEDYLTEYAQAMVQVLGNMKDNLRRIAVCSEWLVLLLWRQQKGEPVQRMIEEGIQQLLESFRWLQTPQDLLTMLPYLGKTLALLQKHSQSHKFFGLSEKNRSYGGSLLATLQEVVHQAAAYQRETSVKERKEKLAELMGTLNTPILTRELQQKVEAHYKNPLNGALNQWKNLIKQEQDLQEQKTDFQLKLLNLENIVAQGTSLEFLVTSLGNEPAEQIRLRMVVTADTMDPISWEQEWPRLDPGETLTMTMPLSDAQPGTATLMGISQVGSQMAHTLLETEITITPPAHEPTEKLSDRYPLAAIKKDDIFFGRDQEMNIIRNGLASTGSNVTFLVYGLRRIGKSSLLHYVYRNAPKPYIPVFCDVQQLTSVENTAELVYDLFVMDTVRTLKQKGISMDMPDEAFFEDNPVRRLGQFFRQLEEHLGEHKLLLLLDEFEAVIDGVQEKRFSNHLFPLLRSQMQHSDKIRLMIAGGGYLVDRMTDDALKISDTAQLLKVGFMDRKGTHSMIQVPYEGELTYLTETLDRVFLMTSGHPYYTSILCKAMVDRMNRENRRVVYPSDVDDAVANTLQMNEKQNYFDHLWETVTDPAERVVLAMTAEASPKNVSWVTKQTLLDQVAAMKNRPGLQQLIYRSKLEEVVDSLQRLGVLTESPDNAEAFRVAVDLWRLFLQRKWTVAKVLDAEGWPAKGEAKDETKE